MTTTRLGLAIAAALACQPVAIALAEPASGPFVRLAQAQPAQPPLTEAEKAKIEQRKREQQKAQPQGGQQGGQQGRSDNRSGPLPSGQPPSGPPPGRQSPPPPPPPPPAKVVAPPPPPLQPKVAAPPPPPPPLPPKVVTPPPVVRQGVAPPQNQQRTVVPEQPPVVRPDRSNQDSGRRRDSDRGVPNRDGVPNRGQQPPGVPNQAPSNQAPPNQGVPPAIKSVTPPPLVTPPNPSNPGTSATRIPPPAFLPTATQRDKPPPPAAAQPRFDELKAGRTQRTEDGGRRTVIVEPGAGNRVIIKQNDRSFIHHDETARFKRLHGDAQTRRRPDGYSETFYVRGDGVRVVSVVDRHGRLVHRYRRDHTGREYSIIDNRRFLRNAAIGAGIGALGVAIALNLPPPRVAIARERYIVAYDRASDDDLYETLSAPPIERLERSYSLDEVRYSYELRQRMRRVDLDTINFEFGSFEVSGEQFPKLDRIARAMRRLLERNPNEVFLIAAHTDAVGGEEDNLSLSDRRAESVANILSEEFGVPAENLVTQGYGEQHLKIETREAEPRNRRVEVQRITPLLSEERR